jgi:hypothetical protein
MTTRTVSTRRHFFRDASTALAVPLVASTALAAAGAAEATTRPAALEDVNAIRALQQAYARLVNAGAHADAAQLFADPSAALLDPNVRRLLADRFSEHDAIELATGGDTATAQLLCTVETETAIGPSCTLVEMARLQGEGVIKRSERRVLESAYVKQAGVWRISHAAYRPA